MHEYAWYIVNRDRTKGVKMKDTDNNTTNTIQVETGLLLVHNESTATYLNRYNRFSNFSVIAPVRKIRTNTVKCSQRVESKDLVKTLDNVENDYTWKYDEKTEAYI